MPSCYSARRCVLRPHDRSGRTAQFSISLPTGKCCLRCNCQTREPTRRGLRLCIGCLRLRHPVPGSNDPSRIGYSGGLAVTARRISKASVAIAGPGWDNVSAECLQHASSVVIANRKVVLQAILFTSMPTFFSTESQICARRHWIRKQSLSLCGTETRRRSRAAPPQ